MPVPLRVQHLSPANKLARAVWNLVWLLFYRPSPAPLHGWRRFLLRLFGATIGPDAHPYPSAKIWAPWNLTMGAHSCLSHQVDCYCVERITLGAHTTVSQYSFLCTASHDYTDPAMPLTTAPITPSARPWALGAWLMSAAMTGRILRLRWQRCIAGCWGKGRSRIASKWSDFVHPDCPARVPPPCSHLKPSKLASMVTTG